MSYFTGINNLTGLQEQRIKLLQNCPEDAYLINREFMQAKDTIIGKRGAGNNPSSKKLPRLMYRVEIMQDNEPYVELKDGCIYVSPPAYQAFNAEYLRGQVELPKVTTPATMAVFIPPLVPAPVFCFT